MEGLVARLAQRMQFGKDDLGNGLAKGLRVHEIVQVVAVGQRQAVGRVDLADDVLDEDALLGERARRVAIDVPLGKSRQVSENGPRWTQELEALGLHPFGLRYNHTGRYFNECAITPERCTL
jgi:hypothetical protein